MKTGDVIWDSPVADYTKGFQITGGPLVAKGKVMQGLGGQSPGGNFIVALDAETGKEAWRFHTIAQPGEPGDSWNGLPNEKRNGASVWTRRQLRSRSSNLAFFGVGQTYDTGPVLHRVESPEFRTTASSPIPRWPSIPIPENSSGISSMCTTISGTSIGPSSSS